MCTWCGWETEVPNADALVKAVAVARAALQALHEEMDDCPGI